MIPENNPKTLEESLAIFETIRYESWGCGVVFLDYNYNFGYWSVSFRNPANFENPKIKEDTPLKAVHKMLDFLRLKQLSTHKTLNQK